MSKRSDITKRVETWTLRRGESDERTIVKIAVRHSDGRFNGATNFRQKA